MKAAAGVGTSIHRNPREAGAEAARAALADAGFDKPDLVLLFATTGYPQEALLAAVRSVTGDAPLAGCSAEGIISADKSVEGPYAVICAVIRSSTLRFDVAMADGMGESVEKVGSAVGAALADKVGDDSLGVLVFADGLTFNFDAFHPAFQAAAGASRFLPMFGGTSADNWELERTYQYMNDKVVTDGVSCVLLSGQANLAWAVNHGCAKIGGERTITRAEGNVIYEIDHRPAFEVMKEYLEVDELEDWNKAAVNFTIGFRAPDALRGLDEYVVRYVPRRDEEEGYIAIGTSVQEGTSVWMMRRDYEKISNGVDVIGRSIQEQLGGESPSLVFQFDCAGRGKVIFQEAEKAALLKQLRGRVGEDAAWIGFHSYGEIGPVGSANWFHNYTAVVVALA